jgi:hypothetical protein
MQSGARGGGNGSVVERIFDHDFSLLVWRGGYLLTRYGSFVAGWCWCWRCICGVAGGAIMFLFLTKVMLPHERELTADETEVAGAVGASRAHSGRRHWRDCLRATGRAPFSPARSEDGVPIPKTGRGLRRSL